MLLLRSAPELRAQGALLREAMLGAQPVFGGLRLREQEALAVAATHVEQSLPLRGLLDALGDHLHAQRVGQYLDRADHCRALVLAFVAELGDERAVDLQRVE